MLKRELLYTAVTRAKESLVIICERDSFIRGIKTQAIRGTSLAEKAEFFKGKESMGKKTIADFSFKIKSFN
jgi:ATP-dependent exoDNAse (exonuclease V) alpha subunit